MFAQPWDCAGSCCGEGEWGVSSAAAAAPVAATSLKTPINVLVILGALGWETDSVKKHLSALRSSE